MARIKLLRRNLCQETWNMDHDIKLSSTSGEICKLNIQKYFKTVLKVERSITHLLLYNVLYYSFQNVINMKEAIYFLDKCIFYMWPYNVETTLVYLKVDR